MASAYDPRFHKKTAAQVASILIQDNEANPYIPKGMAREAARSEAQRIASQYNAGDQQRLFWEQVFDAIPVDA